MSAAELERLKEIFHTARQLRPNERAAFLHESCGADAQLRSEVEALLKSDGAAADFIGESPAQLAAEVFGDAEPISDLGCTIGQYKLIRRIGSGGMGAVYLAERADRQFEMQVAIKLIKRGMDTEQVLRRFHDERQILASLDHPNIARLLDGGTTEDGLPYFVMEYIQGERIDRYADEHRLSLTQRLELFRQVCSAVSYAHQHLVVHRDLKPSNILVTSEGVPKLLDFGIAKIIQADDDPAALATMTVAPMLTPEYASPEQIEGTHATTQSDVYSLGVVLYELLTGSKPYRTTTNRPEEMARAIREQEPTRPSAAAGGNPKSETQNPKLLRGDLDNIILMALRKESARRYRSVEQLSEDIRRHLVGRPVIARPDTLSYRAGKFIQRNKIAVAAAALLLVTLIGGIIATVVQAQRARLAEHRARAEQARAERRFNEVRKLANRVLFDYHDAIKALPGATRARELLVKDALEYLDRLAGEAHGDPALQRELGAAYERVGDVLGAPFGAAHLGDVSGALESYRKALAIREAVAAANPTDVQARRDLASSHKKIGGLLGTTHAAGSDEHLGKAQALFSELMRERPADPELQLELAETSSALGNGLSDRSDFGGALAQLAEARGIVERLLASDPRNRRYRQSLRSVHSRTAYVLNMQGDVQAALTAIARAVELGEALLTEDPLNADYRRALASIYHYRGNFRDETDKRGALEDFRKVAALEEELVAADPANARTRRDLAFTDKKLGEMLVALDDHAEALRYFRRARERFETLVTTTPGDLVARFMIVTCRAGAARTLARLGETRLALEECDRAAAFLHETTGDKPGHLGRAQAHEYLGFAYVALSESPAASPAENRERMRTAREMFAQAQKIIDELRARQGDLGKNEQWAKEIAGEIAKCDAALAN